MKRFIFPVLIIMLCLTGCTREYNSERAIYKATVMAKNILINPDAIPPQEFNRAINAYRMVFEKYPETMSAKRARMATGSLYLAKKENEKAKDVFKNVMKLYPDDKEIMLEARLGIAKSYENENALDKLAAEYKGIIKDYADTETGLQLPMVIAKIYEKEKDAAKTAKAYDEAIEHYTKLAYEYKGKLLGFRADTFKAVCYLNQAQWGKAAGALEKLAMEYPMAKNIGVTIRMISDISINKLNSQDTAIGMIERFLYRYPDHPLKEYLKKGIEAIRNAPVTKN